MSPDAFYSIALFLLGACVGSFLNVCIYRLPAGLSIIWPPSHCFKCLKRVAWYDNLPIISYFILRGKCRRCGATFSPQYAIVEFSVALLFVIFYQAYFMIGVRGPEMAHWGVYFVHMALVAALLVSSMIDLKYKEIYTVVTNSGMVLGVIFAAVFPQLMAQSVGPRPFGIERLDAALVALVGLVVGAGVIWLTAILGKLAFRREAMGFGDVLLMGMIGAVLGWEAAIITFFVAPFFGLTFGLIQLARHGDREVPYGPFLSLGAMTAMLAQPFIINWFAPGGAGLVQLFTQGGG